MDEARTEGFYASGHQDVTTALNHVPSRDPDFQPQRILDFGCGVGRLSLALAEHAADVVGLDVAPAMSAKARPLRLHVGSAMYVSPMPWRLLTV
jgi:2-polyprenyl-3-methyl-5-hydroxy-6-metoxy-1,4-benzoquinol methylase